MRSGLKDVLRPVARFCLRHSLKLQDVVSLIKEVFVEEAQRELVRHQVEPSFSKITAMTGTHRKDVARFLQEGATPPREDLIARVIGHWRQQPQFSKPRGKPLPLSFEGKDNEFSQLVRSVSQDLNPYTVLYELERTGAVTKTEKGLRLNVQLHLIKGDKEAAFKLASADVDDLMQAVEHNIQNASSTPNLHIRTEYDQIALEHESEIREWLLDEGSRFHARAREFLSKYDCDLNPALTKDSSKSAAGRGRVVLGAFSWLDPTTNGADKTGKKR